MERLLDDLHADSKFVAINEKIRKSFKRWKASHHLQINMQTKISYFISHCYLTILLLLKIYGADF